MICHDIVHRLWCAVGLWCALVETGRIVAGRRSGGKSGEKRSRDTLTCHSGPAPAAAQIMRSPASVRRVRYSVRDPVSGNDLMKGAVAFGHKKALRSAQTETPRSGASAQGRQARCAQRSVSCMCGRHICHAQTDIAQTDMQTDIMRPRLPGIEICVDNPAALRAAFAARPDSIELCAALALAGITPGPGLIRAARDMAGFAPVSVHAMIRVRGGDFVFCGREHRAALADVAAVRRAGLSGVVLGAANGRGGLNVTQLRELAAAAAPLEKTLHRVFDIVKNPFEALEQAIELGFDRVLTSGQAASAAQGIAMLERLVQRARGRIAIMAGGGVRPANAERIWRRSGVDMLHGSFGGAFAGGAFASRSLSGRLASLPRSAGTRAARLFPCGPHVALPSAYAVAATRNAIARSAKGYGPCALA